MNLPPNFDPREIAWQLIQAALKAVDPAVAVKNYFEAHPELEAHLKARPGRLIVVGAGKASAPMAVAVAEIFGEQIAAGHIIVKYGYLPTDLPPTARIKFSEAGHPIPDQAGLTATQEIVRLLAGTNEDDTVLCLISGGGSALLSLPCEGITLDDLQTTTASLLAAGAAINEVNPIRKHLSQVKGGSLARLAAPASLYALVLSDVVGDPLPIIASGPTLPDPSTFAQVWTIVEQYQLQAKLPQAVMARLQAGVVGTIPETPKPDDPTFQQVHNAIIGSNRIAAQAAVNVAHSLGFAAYMLSTFIEGEAREVAKVVAGLAKGLASGESTLPRPACLVLGGETTVTLRGKGQGGRNQELALAAAVALEGWSNIFVTSLGTDGSDGPTDAAGAFVDGETVKRARALGLEAMVYLNRNDAYNFFKRLDDLIMTGPTNTNVNDLIFILVW
jgi:hydroxypyruvate reductase